MQIVYVSFSSPYPSRKYAFFAPNSAKVGEKWLADTANGVQIVVIVEAHVSNPVVYPYKWLFQMFHEDWMEDARLLSTHIRELRAKAILIKRKVQEEATEAALKKNKRYQEIQRELASYNLTI